MARDGGCDGGSVLERSRTSAPDRARRRLRRVAAALAPAAAAEAAEAAVLRARMEELQLEQDALQLRLGAITAETMSTTDNVFSPPEGDFSLEEVTAFFRTNGFWCGSGSGSPVDSGPALATPESTRRQTDSVDGAETDSNAACVSGASQTP